MYDLIVIGRGLSSLLFLKQYLHTHSDLKVLIIEKNKKIENRYISSWQGPGLLDLKKEYDIDADKVYKKISISNEEILLKKIYHLIAITLMTINMSLKLFSIV